MKRKKIDVVGAVIKDETGHYLVTMRDKDKHMGGLWEFPGGKIEEGESPEKALVREIQEELGCTIAIEKFLVDHTHNYEEITVRLITYLCKIINGKPSLTEHEEMKWVNAESMMSLTFAEADIPTIKKLIKEV